MAVLKTVNCPNCAGDIQIDGTSQQVTCRYCGTTSFLQRGSQRAPANMPVIIVGSATASMLALAIGLVALLLAGGAAWLAALGSRATPAPPRPPVAQPSLPTPPALAPRKEPDPPPAPVLRILDDMPTLFADADGDQLADPIAPISWALGRQTTEHYAVFDGRTGALRARTPALGERRGALVATLEHRLLLSQRDGQLAAYDLGSGDLQWSSALGERVAALCAGKTAGAAHVTTDAGRQLYLDLVTGRQAPTQEGCRTLLARADSARDPRDRRDYQAPSEVESYTCGAVRVMGDQNFSVADACRARAHIDTDRLDGMVGHRLWRQGTDWLVFGVRKPGAYVPMVGRLRRGRFVWKSEVPAQNPLEVQEGGPRFVALAGDQLDIAYQSERGATWWVTAFGAADGVRRWTREVPGEGSGLEALGAAADRVFVVAKGSLLLLDAAGGELKAVAGREHDDGRSP
jgi:hypothetical protein